MTRVPMFSGAVKVTAPVPFVVESIFMKRGVGRKSAWMRTGGSGRPTDADEAAVPTAAIATPPLINLALAALPEWP